MMEKRLKGGGSFCAAPNCQNTRKKGWRLFSFPAEEKRCKKWVRNCRRSDLMDKTVAYLRSNCCICAAHFEPSQFMRAENPKCRLIWNAVPTIFDVPNPPKMLGRKRKLIKRKEEPSSEFCKQVLAESDPALDPSSSLVYVESSAQSHQMVLKQNKHQK